MKSIRSFLFAIGVLFSVSALAAETKTLSMFCHDQYWQTSPPESGKAGDWMTGIGAERTVTLTKDPNYPNPLEPRTFWLGKHTETMNGANVEVDIKAIERNGKSEGYMNTISIAFNGIVAESEGGSYLRAALRSTNSGVGVICHQMELQ